MAISKFIIQAEVTTEGGAKFAMSADRADNSAFFVLSVSSPEMKLTQADLAEIIRMFSNCAGSRNLAK